ncbi:MAG: thioredoxin [Firmicutes bacterium]|nr:thioredoxin [Bacillota bacterium]
MINKIENNDLSAAKAAKIALVDFSAEWCGPCRMLAPIFDELSEELAGKVEFYSCDVDQNNAAAREFAVMSIPNIVLLKNGALADRQVGFMPKEMLKNWIEEYFD